MNSGKNKDFVNKNRFVIVLFIVSFFLHLFASIFLYHKFGQSVLFFDNEDALGYISIAESLVAGEGFSRNGMPSAVRTPVYPLFLAVLYFLRLPMPWSILILQNIIASLSGFILYKIGKNLFSERVGQIAGFIYIIEPYMLMTSNLATTETFFNFLIICFFYFFSHFYISETGGKELILSGIFLGLATLTRPIALYAILLVALLLAVRFLFFSHKIKKLILSFLLFFAAFISVLFPWSLRQHNLFGSWRITNIDANMLYFRTAPIVVSKQEGVSYTEAIDILKIRLKEKFPDFDDEKVYNSFDYYSYMSGETKRLVQSDPMLVFRTFAVSAMPAMFGTGYDYMLEDIGGIERKNARLNYSKLLLDEGFGGIKTVIANIDIFFFFNFGGAAMWGVFYLLILLSLIHKEVWRRYAIAIIPILGFLGYFVFFSLGASVHARYRMPSFPFILLLFGFALDFFYKKCIIKEIDSKV